MTPITITLSPELDLGVVTFTSEATPSVLNVTDGCFEVRFSVPDAFCLELAAVLIASDFPSEQVILNPTINW